MSTPGPISLVSAAIYLLVSLTFGIIVQNNFLVSARRGSFPPLIRVSSLACVALSIVFGISTVFALVPLDTHESLPPLLGTLYVISDLATFLGVALFAHLIRLLAVRDGDPSRTWVVVNYGVAATVLLFSLPVQDLLFENPVIRSGIELLKWSYVLGVALYASRQLWLQGDRSSWRAGAMGRASRADFWALVGASACLTGMVFFHAIGSWAVHRQALTLLAAILGVFIALPFVARNLGSVLAGLLSALGLLSAVAAALFVGIRLGDVLPTELRLLAPLATVVILLLALGPGQPALLAAVDRLVFRRSRLRREELAHFLRNLSPDLGATECTHRALAELRKVLRLRGVALLLRDGGIVAEGDIDADTLRAGWPRGEEAERLTDRPRFGDDETGLPPAVRDLLNDCDILGVIAVRGSSRFWGHLLLRTDLIATVYRDDGTVTVEVFADQLAVLLDAAGLLDRAIGVERSLAHSEKLAAMGELSARIAHDIRNPITAARSLAQQLAAEPQADEAHTIIVEELERVDRHVSDLLRFSRRDELDCAPVDLAALVRETVSRLRGRLESEDIRVEIRGPQELEVWGDRERLRHVLINLVENAADALSENGSRRRIAIAFEGTDECARFSVADNGPGIPEAALDEVFEPFVSSKPKGTGLGLAIVRRTIEAHGGRIRAAACEDTGVAFEVELPSTPPTREEAS